MQIAIISDLHDNSANLNSFIKYIKKIKADMIICCGDVCNFDTLAHLANSFSGDIHLVYGNMELYDESATKEFKNIKYYGRIGNFEADNIMAGICHEPYLIDKALKRAECKIVFYGHTHKPWIEKRGKAALVNPGTLGGVFQKSTFALWETNTGKLELKALSEI